MNKRNITAYMFLLWAILSLGGCAGKGQTQMYLEAKVQDTQAAPGSGEDPGNAQISGKDLDGKNPDGENKADKTDKTEDKADKTGGPGGLDETDSAGKASGSGTCFVYVCGAVKHPGVFELPQGSRIYEAIALAGGLRGDADTKGINQALKVEDGDMIEVLTAKEQRELEEEARAGAAKGGQETDGTGGADGQDKGSQGQDAQDGLVDINTASAGELMTLNGIGEAKAANIIAYRESHGKFGSIQEIMNVSGIGEGVYAKIQDKIKATQ